MTRALALATLTLAWATAAVAQSPRDALTRGIEAYQNLDYETAASQLALAVARAAGGLSPQDHVRALGYLGATELFRGHRDSAGAVFRTIVLDDPQYRLDGVVFPPQVTDLFDAVRRGSHAIALSVPPLTHLEAGKPFTALVLTTTPQAVTVAVTAGDGTPVRTLYSGPIADTVTVVWDGAASDGAGVPSGRYLLRAAPADTARAARLARSIPLNVSRAPADTLPVDLPPDDTQARSASPYPRAARSVAVGVLATIAAIALPSIVASGTPVTGARYAVGGAIGIATIVGLVRGRPPVGAPADPDERDALRAAWRHRADSLHAENERRRARAPLEIRVMEGRGGEP